jgi:hypothetical protein
LLNAEVEEREERRERQPASAQEPRKYVRWTYVPCINSEDLTNIWILLTTKNVHFMKLSKCVTDLTIAFLSSRWSKNIYETSNLESG